MKQQKSICEEIEEKVLKFVQERTLLQPKDRVLAGVSGGADSVCLLFMLLFLKKRMQEELHIEVVHVHHMIRGEEADEDMAYVENLCAGLRVAFHGVQIPVPRIAGEQGLSLEEAGRKVRYDTFEKLCQKQNLTKIAVAHHKDDQAETVFMNLLRGSGMKGAAGIPAKREKIVRPLLCLTRKEIELYLREKAVNYCTDSTNHDCEYTRNKVRNRIFPYLVKHVNAKALEHLVSFGEQAEEVDDYFQKQAHILLEKYGKLNEKRVILSLDCMQEPGILRTYIIRLCLEKTGGGLKNISAVHMKQIQQLMEGRTGTIIQLPRGIRIEKSYDEIIFFQEKSEIKQAGKEVLMNFAWESVPGNPNASERDEEKRQINLVALEENHSYRVAYGDGFFCFRVKNVKNFQTFPKKKYTKWFDYDTIKFTLQLRRRMPGDFLVINAAGGKKKLKDYFIDARISRHDREGMTLLAEGSEILWIVGERISERYKVQEATKKVLEVTYEENCVADGGQNGREEH